MTIYSVKKIVFESYPILLFSALISFTAGVFLDAQLHTIKILPVILVMIPPINGINGNVCSILGARLGSALHMGMIEARLKRQKALSGNLTATIALGAATFAVAGMIFFYISVAYGLGLITSLILFGTFFVASIVAVAVTMFCTVLLAFISFKKGLDPDNVVIPTLTSIGDVVGVICLITATKIVMGV